MYKEKLLTVKEVGQNLNISESTVRKLVRESKIPFVRIFSKILFKSTDIELWLDKKRDAMLIAEEEVEYGRGVDNDGS